MKKVLVLCTGNSCRSQIAHGYLKNMLGDNAEVYSAGIETHGVNPRAIKVLSEDNIDISMHTSNNINEYENIEMDYVLTVCDNAKQSCPIFPAKSKVTHYSFPDPAHAEGTEEEILNHFREVRDLIKNFCSDYSKEIL